MLGPVRSKSSAHERLVLSSSRRRSVVSVGIGWRWLASRLTLCDVSLDITRSHVSIQQSSSKGSITSCFHELRRRVINNCRRHCCCSQDVSAKLLATRKAVEDGDFVSSPTEAALKTFQAWREHRGPAVNDRLWSALHAACARPRKSSIFWQKSNFLNIRRMRRLSGLRFVFTRDVMSSHDRSITSRDSRWECKILLVLHQPLSLLESCSLACLAVKCTWHAVKVSHQSGDQSGIMRSWTFEEETKKMNWNVLKGKFVAFTITCLRNPYLWVEDNCALCAISGCCCCTKDLKVLFNGETVAFPLILDGEKWISAWFWFGDLWVRPWIWMPITDGRWDYSLFTYSQYVIMTCLHLLNRYTAIACSEWCESKVIKIRANFQSTLLW